MDSILNKEEWYNICMELLYLNLMYSLPPNPTCDDAGAFVLQYLSEQGKIDVDLKDFDQDISTIVHKFFPVLMSELMSYTEHRLVADGLADVLIDEDGNESIVIKRKYK